MSLPLRPTISTSNSDLLFYCIVPVERFTSKKNAKRVFKNKAGKSFIGQDQKTKATLNHLTYALQLQAKRQIDEIISIPIMLTLRFHYPFTKKGEIPKKLMDLSNLYQGPEDALQAAKIILDDSLIESHNGSCRVYGAPQKAIEIAIFRWHQKIYEPKLLT